MTLNERRLVPGDRYGNKRNVKAVQILRLNKERNLRFLTSPNISELLAKLRFLNNNQYRLINSNGGAYTDIKTQHAVI